MRLSIGISVVVSVLLFIRWRQNCCFGRLLSYSAVSGFLPVEREWIGNFIDSGFIDSFRHFNGEPHNYTWWSYRANARSNNKGWRLDYGMVNESLKDRLRRSVILSEAKHSDHCPILLEVD